MPLKKSATTGHLLKTSTGHLAKGCDSCVTDCCSSADSKTITLTGTEIETDDCLDFGDEGSIRIDEVAYTLDGTYCATFNAGTCSWVASSTFYGRHDASTTGCDAGALGDLFEMTFTITIRRIREGDDCGTYVVSITFQFGPMGQQTVFTGQTATKYYDTDCDDGSIEVDLTALDLNSAATPTADVSTGC